MLGLGAQHRGIVELSEDRDVCDSVRLLYLLTYEVSRDQVIREYPASRGAEESADVLVVVLEVIVNAHSDSSLAGRRLDDLSRYQDLSVELRREKPARSRSRILRYYCEAR